LDVAAQIPTDHVDVPLGGEKSWWTLDATSGYEMLLLAVSDQALGEGRLEEFERRSAFAPRAELEFKHIAVIGSNVERRRSRGLSGVVTSPKNPLDPDFEKSLEQQFDAYYGLAFPHQ